MLASGVDKHGTNSSNPLKYSHLDIAGSAGIQFLKFENLFPHCSLCPVIGDLPDKPTGAPLLAMAKTHLI